MAYICLILLYFIFVCVKTSVEMFWPILKIQQKKKCIFQSFKSSCNFYCGRPTVHLSFETFEIWLKKDEGFYCRDVFFLFA